MREAAILALFIGIAAVLAGIGSGIYWDGKARADATRACFESGGTSISSGWRAGTYTCERGTR